MLETNLLLTDLYELSMLEAYAAQGMAETAVFELFFRKGVVQKVPFLGNTGNR